MAIKKKLKQKTRQLVDSKHMLSSITMASFLESTIVLDFPCFTRHQMSYIVTSIRGVYEQRQTVYPRV